MVGQSLWLTILAVIGGPAAIVGLFVMGKWVWNSFSKVFLFRGLSIHAIKRVSYRSVGHVVLKMAFVGKEDVIVEEVVVQSKLVYPRRFGGLLAWLHLGLGYMQDDVEGLNTVLGRSYPYMGLLAAPVHIIKNKYIRRPLSVIWGAILLYYFILFAVIPLFWPLLFWGPYQELRLFSGDKEVVLLKEEDKVQLERPFIVKPGFEKCLRISHRPSLYIQYFMSKRFVRDAKISYEKEPSELGGRGLPRNDEFIWKAKDILRVKICGKLRTGYRVKIGDSYVRVRL